MKVSIGGIEFDWLGQLDQRAAALFDPVDAAVRECGAAVESRAAETLAVSIGDHHANLNTHLAQDAVGC